MHGPNWLTHAPGYMAMFDEQYICHDLSPEWREALGLPSSVEVTLPLEKLLSVNDETTSSLLQTLIDTSNPPDGISVQVNCGIAELPGRVRTWPLAILNSMSLATVQFDAISPSSVGPRNHQELLLESVGGGIYGLDSDETNQSQGFQEIIGVSVELKRTLAQVKAVAPTSANVLIEGESGVGKEGIAREIHTHSTRSAQPNDQG